MIAAASQTNQTACSDRPKESAPLDPHAKQLFDALTRENKERETRVEALRQLLANPPESVSTAGDWLRQKALLAVAADDLDEGNLARARQRLRRVPVDSPASVDAALLLAESYRLAGEPRQARQWYLRVGERFPREQAALEGVLSAGVSLEPEAPKTAVALYGNVSAKASETAERLRRLGPQLENQKLQWLFRSDSNPALRRQLLEQLARQEGEGAVKLKQKEVANTTRLQCLLRQSRPVYRAQVQLEDRLDRLDTQAVKAHKRIRALEEQKAELEERIKAGELTEEQKQIREKAMQVRNTLQRKRARLKFLEQNRKRLPRMVNKLENRIQRLYEYFSDQQRWSSQALQRRLNKALKSLRQDFLDLAASADHRKARVLEESLSRSRKEAE